MSGNVFVNLNNENTDDVIDSNSCTICFERFTYPVVLNCGHTFDYACIINQKLCPICREYIKHKVLNRQVADILNLKIENVTALDSDCSTLSKEYNIHETNEIISEYQIVDHWALLIPGIRIAFTLEDRTKFPEVNFHQAWVHNVDLENEIIYLYYHYGEGKICSLRANNIKELRYHPTLQKPKPRRDRICVIV